MKLLCGKIDAVGARTLWPIYEDRTRRLGGEAMSTTFGVPLPPPSYERGGARNWLRHQLSAFQPTSPVSPSLIVGDVLVNAAGYVGLGSRLPRQCWYSWSCCGTVDADSPKNLWPIAWGVFCAGAGFCDIAEQLEGNEKLTMASAVVSASGFSLLAEPMKRWAGSPSILRAGLSSR